MKLEVDEADAIMVLRAQFTKYAERVNECLRLFDLGHHSKAYEMFPYHDQIGKNLEEFIQSFIQSTK